LVERRGVSIEGAGGGSLELRDAECRHHDDTTPSTADTVQPRSRDVAGNDVSGTTAGDWVQQLVDMSSMLSRFIGLEYFSDGAALTKALWFW